MNATKIWNARVEITETEATTQARVMLRMGEVERTGTGSARRSPSDPDVPRIGDELATARALSDLSHQLVDESADLLEAALGKPVELTR